MYFGDHNPPHFHIVYPDGEALIELETLAVLEGSVPSKIFDPAIQWAAANRESLLNKWQELHE